MTLISGPERTYSEATEDCLSSFSLLRDPYEAKLVEIGQSSVAGGGEGLFAKVDLPAGTLVTLYNGVRRGPYSPVETPEVQSGSLRVTGSDVADTCSLMP